MAEVGPKKQYRYWCSEEGLDKLREWAKLGLSNQQIAKNMGVHQSTFYDWRNKFPEIDEATQEGKDIIDLEVENALLKRAMGYETEELIYKVMENANGTGQHEMGLAERRVKTVPPDVGALIYWLKNRQNQKWSHSPFDDLKKAKLVAETENIKTKTELIKGVAKDTSMLDSLVNVLSNK